MKKLLMLLAVLSLSACDVNDADVVSKNLSTASDNFEVNRRVVFYNGITGDYMLSIEGLCSKDNSSTANTLGIVCKVGPNQYKKHLLGLSDNVTFFIEQIDGVKASPYFYRVTFKPSVIAPDIDIR
ncbi:hypothetical protein L7815_012085 [Serratia marcescens]|uniref:beta-sandwich lipoprotein n=1 Tax=Serratia TaxID=613 RepID=UPI000B5EDE9F|nr:hypothetical protein [Serratia marcescens]ASM17978.1 hypothetical protein BVG90_15120 [Serratia marcescens]AVE51989.1 hypothetical protein AM354_21495 [Serratia marcescens]ELD1858194.1 hypothetical protein [Serratia marcescens]MBE8816257.1 hypothetical protein [Serratia marcescens]MBN5442933.1 hypothetical protein [Serratia marcescens]